MIENKINEVEFMNSIADYSRAIELGDEPTSLAKEFMNSFFDDDVDAAFAYAEVLENFEDARTAGILEAIVLNSSRLVIEN